MKNNARQQLDDHHDKCENVEGVMQCWISPSPIRASR